MKKKPKVIRNLFKGLQRCFGKHFKPTEEAKAKLSSITYDMKVVTHEIYHLYKGKSSLSDMDEVCYMLNELSDSIKQKTMELQEESSLQ